MRTLNEVWVSFNVAFGPIREDGNLPAVFPSTAALHRFVSDQVDALCAHQVRPDEGPDVMADGQAVMSIVIFEKSRFTKNFLRLVQSRILEALDLADIPEAAKPRIHSIDEVQISTLTERTQISLAFAA